MGRQPPRRSARFELVGVLLPWALPALLCSQLFLRNGRLPKMSDEAGQNIVEVVMPTYIMQPTEDEK